MKPGPKLPRNAEAVIRELLIARMPHVSIAQTVGVSRPIVQRIANQNSDLIPSWRDLIAAQCRQAARLLIARLIDNIDKVPIEKVPVSVGILIDKVRELEGGPSQHIVVERVNVDVGEIRSKMSSYLGYSGNLAGEAAKQVLDVQVEPAPETPKSQPAQ